LNGPAGGAVDYRALGGHVMLTLADIKSISSLDPAHVGIGHSGETDVVFWIPAGAYVDGVLDRLEFFIAYIWVTTGYALAPGREVFGFPKALAWVQLPQSPEDPGPLWTETMVIPQFAPESALERRRVFTLERPAGLASRGPTFGPGETL